MLLVHSRRRFPGEREECSGVFQPFEWPDLELPLPEAELREMFSSTVPYQRGSVGMQYPSASIPSIVATLAPRLRVQA